MKYLKLLAKYTWYRLLIWATGMKVIMRFTDSPYLCKETELEQKAKIVKCVYLLDFKGLEDLGLIKDVGIGE